MSMDSITEMVGSGGSGGAGAIAAGFNPASLGAEAMNAALAAGNSNESKLTTGAKTTNLNFGSEGTVISLPVIIAALVGLYIVKRKA